MGNCCGATFCGNCHRIILVVANGALMLMAVIGMFLLLTADATKATDYYLGYLVLQQIWMGQVTSSFYVMILIVGICAIFGIVFILALIGLVGTCAKSRCALTCNAVFMLIFCVLSLFVAVYSLTMMSLLIGDANLKTDLTSMLGSYEEDKTGMYPYIFHNKKCCGVNQEQNSTYEFSSITWTGKETNQLRPKTCCVGLSGLESLATYSDPNCTDSDEYDTEFHQTSCFTIIKDGIGATTMLYCILVAIVLGMQVISATVAYVVRSEIERPEFNQVDIIPLKPK